MKIQHAREIKVGILAAVCLFLLFFGFNFLKGVNIFSPTNNYHGIYHNLHGLEEQAAVYIRGHKVGQVDAIHYDFVRDSAFTIDISVNRDIALPQGTRMAIISDGLLGGVAIELQFPENISAAEPIERGTLLPTTYVPGLVESLQGELLTHIDQAVQDIDSLIASLQDQIEGDHIQATLANVDRVSGDLTVVSSSLKGVMSKQLPRIINNADTAISDLGTVVADIKAADLKSTIARVDTAIGGVGAILDDVRGQEGTLGQLIYDRALYDHLDATVVSADSLLVDLKAHPKRYVHFSLFGKKDK